MTESGVRQKQYYLRVLIFRKTALNRGPFFFATLIAGKHGLENNYGHRMDTGIRTHHC